jgi:tRNA threonylcarbamoyladenosine biosynthesis protein TsaB
VNALLAFDTATEHLSVALDVQGRVLTHEAAGGAQASTTLIPSILALLSKAGVALRDLDAIAFGHGPGAFTGLRTACSVAQGLALGVGKPVLPVSTLLAVAEDARAGMSESVHVWVAMDARMNEIYAAQYAFEEGRWTTLDAPMLTTPEILNRRLQPSSGQRLPDMIAGNALAVFGAQLVTGDVRLFPDALPRASAMLPLAHALWQQGGAVDAALALPLYLRDKVAQTTLERDALRVSKAAVAASR